jgi:hypothetical protein
MLSIEVIKQSLEGNSNKGINSLLLKKTIISSIKRQVSGLSVDYQITNIIQNILENGSLQDEEKTQLFSELKEKVYKDYENTKKELEELFGSVQEAN